MVHFSNRSKYFFLKFHTHIFVNDPHNIADMTLLLIRTEYVGYRITVYTC